MTEQLRAFAADLPHRPLRLDACLVLLGHARRTPVNSSVNSLSFD
jgi:hypothetical protein